MQMLAQWERYAEKTMHLACQVFQHNKKPQNMLLCVKVWVDSCMRQLYYLEILQLYSWQITKIPNPNANKHSWHIDVCLLRMQRFWNRVTHFHILISRYRGMEPSYLNLLPIYRQTIV